MAKTRRGGKTAAVSEHLSSHPGAMPAEIAAALSKQGIKITPAHVSNIKASLKKGGKVKGKVKAAAAAPAESAADKPSAPNGTITLDLVRKAAQTVKALGGIRQLDELLEVIKEAGGMKKFKDLAEAMAVAEPDVIPY